MPLTAIQINNLRPRDKDYWVSDERGLRLLVKKNGALYWRMKYRFAGKQKTLALGVYPDVSLKQARIAREKARLQLTKGVDPCRERQIAKRQFQLEQGKLFSALALDWWEHQRGTWTAEHADRIWKRLKNDTFKVLDAHPLDQLEPRDIINVIRDVEERGALDVASRVLQDIRRVFRFGVQTGVIAYNPATELSGVLKARKTSHRASMPIDELGQFVLHLSNYASQGRYLTQLAIELLMLTFVRPGEVRGAYWSEFDFDKRLWRIPAARMKMNSEHIVPLSNEVVRVLAEALPISSQYELVFPSERKRDTPISDNTMRLAMFRMGYDGMTEGKSRATPHGFRANASSLLNEKGFNADAIERQLSHIERNGVRAAYTHHARYMDTRIEMMQWWADFLVKEATKAGAVKPFHAH